MTGDPIWLKIALGMVPVLAAIVAGFFALSNTLNKRIERLKNLVEIQKAPDLIDPLNTVANLIYAELGRLERLTSPEGRKTQRGIRAFYCLTPVVYGSLVLSALGIGEPISTTVLAVSSLLGCGIFWITTRAFERRREYFKKRLDKLDAEYQQKLLDKWR
ncbi:Uncharacterised protein [Mycolicibacterium aurum]|uniref:Transmembrane protein n=1 Tax=Mycolicibacterium aurum TaxID=1791 RepID=A0A3S4RRY1_MYCAU|nr:hypothetical protein [Mycolicibacterium aurum]VEG57093.1 Uncharacterised protein [Mycolicibacterium aurum]